MYEYIKLYFIVKENSGSKDDGQAENVVLSTGDGEIHTVIDAVVAAEQVLSDTHEQQSSRNEHEEGALDVSAASGMF